jgi:hypothetical protein
MSPSYHQDFYSQGIITMNFIRLPAEIEVTTTITRSYTCRSTRTDCHTLLTRTPLVGESPNCIWVRSVQPEDGYTLVGLEPSGNVTAAMWEQAVKLLVPMT